MVASSDLNQRCPVREAPGGRLPRLPVFVGSGLKALSLDLRVSCWEAVRSLFSSQWPFPYHLPLPLPGFSLIHLVATGVSCFLGSGLLTLAVYLSCQHCQRQSQESTLVHPATPNHLHYKGGGTPKNEKYTPMEFKVGA